MEQSDVLIVGAGPTGLVLALWLTKAGVKVRIIDKTADPGTTSRALAVQARTLELYRQLDLTDAVVARAIGFLPSISGSEANERPAYRLKASVRADALPLPAHLSAGRARAAADRAARGARCPVERQTELLSFTESGRRHHRTPAWTRRQRARSAKRAISPAATARARRCGRPSAPAFPAAPTSSSSMSPTSRPKVPRSMAN